MENSKKKNLMGELFVLLAAALWGSISLMVRPLNALGFSSLQITCVRAVLATLVIGVFLLIKDRSLFKVKLKHIPIFLGSGVISFLFFNYCYMSSIEQNSVSVAAILLYTSPVWVTVFSAIIFKEKVTVYKIIALVVALGGAVMLSFSGTLKITGLGVLFGIGSGLGYALYSVFGKIAAKYYKPETTTFYTFLFAAIFAIPVCRVWEIPSLIGNNTISLAYFAGVTVFATVLPYIFYTLGLTLIPAGKAGIIAIAEPVVAAIVGWIAYGEALGVLGIIGILVVVSALIFMELAGGKSPHNQEKKTTTQEENKSWITQDVFTYVESMEKYFVVLYCYEKLYGGFCVPNFMFCQINRPSDAIEKKIYKGKITEKVVEEYINKHNIDKAVCERLKSNSALRYAIDSCFHESFICEVNIANDILNLTLNVDTQCFSRPNVESDIITVSFFNFSTEQNVGEIKGLFIDELRVNFEKDKIGFYMRCQNRGDPFVKKEIILYFDDVAINVQEENKNEK